MTVWRIAALILFTVAVGCAIALYDTTERLANCLNANRLLSEAFVGQDAELQAVIDKTNGTLYVRVNGKHVHVFKDVCGIRL